MKKLMVLAAVAVVAIASQAANITWGARNIYIPVATDVKVDQAGIVMNSGSKFSADALTVALYWVATDGTKTALGNFATTSSGLIGAQTLGNSSTDTALYTAMLSQGDTYKPQYYFTATYTTADGTYAYEGTVSASSAIGNLPSSTIGVTANFANAGSWSYTAASVPEPTSGLMLLLGMAGLALKRRRV